MYCREWEIVCSLKTPHRGGSILLRNNNNEQTNKQIAPPLILISSTLTIGIKSVVTTTQLLCLLCCSSGRSVVDSARWSCSYQATEASRERKLHHCTDGLGTERKDTRRAPLSPRPHGVLHRVPDEGGGEANDAKFKRFSFSLTVAMTSFKSDICFIQTALEFLL